MRSLALRYASTSTAQPDKTPTVGPPSLDRVSALADTSVLVDYLRGLDLWTLNVRHFPMFQGLRPPW